MEEIGIEVEFHINNMSVIDFRLSFKNGDYSSNIKYLSLTYVESRSGYKESYSSNR